MAIPSVPFSASSRRDRLWFLLLTGLVVAGCGGGPPGTAKVSGKVTVKGVVPAPVTTVTFTSSSGKAASATVSEDGSYSMAEAPVGPVRITLRGPVAAAPSRPAMSGMSAYAGGAAVPQKYAQPGAALSYTVTSGAQTHDIELTP